MIQKTPFLNSFLKRVKAGKAMKLQSGFRFQYDSKAASKSDESEDHKTISCGIQKESDDLLLFEEETARVVDEYEDYLRYCLITTSSFQDIANHKLDARKRLQQLLLIVRYCVFIFPLYATYLWSYTRDEETREWIQYWLVDSLAQLGIFGRVINVCYVVYPVYIVADKIVLRRFESQGSLEFLTDISSLKSSTLNNKTLDNQDKKNIVLFLKRLLFLGKLAPKHIVASIMLYNVIGCVLFIKNAAQCSSKNGWIPGSQYVMSLAGVIKSLLVFPDLVMCMRHIVGVSVTFIVTTELFHGSINAIVRRIDDSCRLMDDKTKSRRNTFPCDSVLNEILLLYNQLQASFKRRNASMRYILRNMIYFFCIGLSLSFFMPFLSSNRFLRIAMIFTSTGLTLTFLGCTWYVGQLNARLLDLYKGMNRLAARLSVSLKANSNEVETIRQKRQLQTAIKELANQENDGQFVLGLTDGKGGVFSSLEIFKLTMETIGLTLMAMTFLSQYL